MSESDRIKGAREFAAMLAVFSPVKEYNDRKLAEFVEREVKRQVSIKLRDYIELHK